VKAAVKVGRNDPCPCGSGQKFKKCCGPKGVPWEELFRSRDPAMITEMTARGRNLAFLDHAAGALQLDSLADIKDWRVVKRACTPEAVRKIHEAVIGFWPDEDNYYSILAQERDKESGIYIGSYEPEFIMRGITRHAIYSESIILFDPFMDARTIAPRFNPLLHPKKFRTATLKNLYLWLSLAPWIEAGLVKMLPSPTDFDGQLALDTIRSQQRKVENSPGMQAALDDSEEIMDEVASFYRTYMLLHTPDDKLAEEFGKANPDSTHNDLTRFLDEVRAERESHPYFIAGSLGDGKEDGEFTSTTTGASFPIAKMVAGITGAHLITDISSKWYEIESDRRESGVELGKWTPFAKAFQSVEFPFLNNVPLQAALTLRREDRLQGMRGFLRKVWKEARSNDEFEESNAVELAAELRDRIAEAEKEWNGIDRDLATWVGGEAVVSAVIGIASGEFFAAAPFILGGVTHLLTAHSARKDFAKCYPAAFFMNLKKKHRT
jgi:hypothetical protein